MPKKAVQVRMKYQKNSAKAKNFIVQYYYKYSMISVLQSVKYLLNL